MAGEPVEPLPLVDERGDRIDADVLRESRGAEAGGGIGTVGAVPPPKLDESNAALGTYVGDWPDPPLVGDESVLCGSIERRRPIPTLIGDVPALLGAGGGFDGRCRRPDICNCNASPSSDPGGIGIGAVLDASPMFQPLRWVSMLGGLRTHRCIEPSSKLSACEDVPGSDDAASERVSSELADETHRLLVDEADSRTSGVQDLSDPAGST